MAKKRTDIPRHVAARVLFLSNRTCCVCRPEGKPVQIHHVDDDPSNHSLSNLAILCFDCHRETQLRGGFDRKLDADQVVLFREDWHAHVSQKRTATNQASAVTHRLAEVSLAISTSVAEIYRENREYLLLAIHYNAIGNNELRDKYIEIALQGTPSDEDVCFLRGLQEKPGLIPADVLEREVKRYSRYKDFTQRGRLYATVGRAQEAAHDYIRGISRSLERGNVFSAAYYIKELASDGLLEELFVLALKQAEEKDDLWWQVRAMQELGWDKELDELLVGHRDEIEESDNPELQRLLAEALGDLNGSLEMRKEIARRESAVVDGVEMKPSQASNEPEKAQRAAARHRVKKRGA